MGDWRELTAADVMSTPAVTVSPETPLTEVIATLSERGFSGAPVVGARGKLAGVISLFDVVTFLSGMDRPLNRPGGFHGPAYPDLSGPDGAARWERAVGRREEDLLDDTTVADLMSGEVVSVTPQAPLAEVAALLTKRRIHRVVVADDGVPVGVVSTLDILGTLDRGTTGARRPAARRAKPKKSPAR